ncbi:MAG: RsmE family RNA methyltransferase [Candidatus Dojkabacteria bacterium]
MRTVRLFYPNLPDKQIGNSFAIRDDEQIRHLKVLRIERNDYNFQVSDGQGLVFSCIYKTRNDSGYLFEITELARDDSENSLLTNSCLILPIIHPGKLEIAVEQAVQLNMYCKILLYFADHNRLSENRFSENKIARLERIAQSAHKQSLGSFIPEISLAERLEAALEECKATEKLNYIPDLAERKDTPTLIGEDSGFNLIIGPEGGFSEKERELMEKLPTKLYLNLPGSVLTSETASTVFSGIIKSSV